jgi:hypothetical protein
MRIIGQLQLILMDMGHRLMTYSTQLIPIQQGKMQQKIEDYELREDEILMFRGRIYVPNVQDLKNMLLT